MLLALDFEVESDILKTVLVPFLHKVSILVVVVGMRIVLSGHYQRKGINIIWTWRIMRINLSRTSPMILEYDNLIFYIISIDIWIDN